MVNLLRARNQFNDIKAMTGPESQYYDFESEYKDFHIWDSFVSHIESNTIDSLATAQLILDYPMDDMVDDYLFYKQPFLNYLDNRGETLNVFLS